MMMVTLFTAFTIVGCIIGGCFTAALLIERSNPTRIKRGER